MAWCCRLRPPHQPPPPSRTADSLRLGCSKVTNELYTHTQCGPVRAGPAPYTVRGMDDIDVLKDKWAGLTREGLWCRWTSM